jgi:arginyl-tRNA synthetase
LNSVLKKANTQKNNSKLVELSPDERNLLIGILDFERTVQGAFDNRATDILANYAYDLCQLVNTFYHNCPILRDDVDEQIREQRLQIVQIAFNTLATVIDLMGLKIPDEM